MHILTWSFLLSRLVITLLIEDMGHISTRSIEASTAQLHQAYLAERDLVPIPAPRTIQASNGLFLHAAHAEIHLTSYAAGREVSNLACYFSSTYNKWRQSHLYFILAFYSA